jgi:hypothetical protein
MTKHDGLIQHIGWLRQYLEGMTDRNWVDMRARALRQLDELSKAINGQPLGDSE